MALEFVDIALVEVDGVEMESIKSLSVTPTNPKEPVKTMNAARVALGVTQGVQSFPFKMTVANLKVPEVDWQAWCLSKQAKLVVYEQAEDGRRIALVDCYCNSVDEKYDENGESTLELDCFALRRKED